MYIYLGKLNYHPYAIDESFFLVIETDFKFGASVRAFWTWTEDVLGTKNVVKLSCGLIDRIETADSPTAGTTFGICYDLYYPFDLFIGDDNTKIALTMYQYPKSNPDHNAVATFGLHLVYSGRMTSPYYDPVKALPEIRYYKLGQTMPSRQLFTMIVPGNLCDDAIIWLTYQDSHARYCEISPMTLVDQSDTTITVTFDIVRHRAKMVLDKDDAGWEFKGWKQMRRKHLCLSTTTAYGSNFPQAVNLQFLHLPTLLAKL
jgi:hypothetical protein